MSKKMLIADDDMSAQQLLFDILEIIFRGAKIERAMSPQSFWEKITANEPSEPWRMVFISTEYIGEDPAGFIDRLKNANPDALDKTIIMGSEAESETLNGAVKHLPYLPKPFSLDEFEAVVKDV
jgi:DNA-binding NtrC family response regulator